MKKVFTIVAVAAFCASYASNQKVNIMTNSLKKDFKQCCTQTYSCVNDDGVTVSNTQTVCTETPGKTALAQACKDAMTKAKDKVLSIY